MYSIGAHPLMRLSEHPVLRLPQFDKPMIVCTDASDVGVGAVLMQKFNDEKLPIVYAGRNFKFLLASQ